MATVTATGNVSCKVLLFLNLSSGFVSPPIFERNVLSFHLPSLPPQLVRMDRGAFQRLLGPLDSMIEMRKYTASGAELTATAIAAIDDTAKHLTVVPKDHVFEKARFSPQPPAHALCALSARSLRTLCTIPA